MTSKIDFVDRKLMSPQSIFY